MRLFFFACVLSLAGINLGAEGAIKQGSREIVNLEEWKVWLDKKASWKNDTLYAPGDEDFAKMPVNAPTCGWDKLYATADRGCKVPATIEEMYSGGNQTWQFRGVCWYVCQVDIPAEWSGRQVRLAFEQTRQRAELYVNGKLCGYDLVAETPWTADITPHLKFGRKNQVAVRITNASGGGRGWEDYIILSWGKYKVPHSNDFTGIGGRVQLLATDKIFIEDVFVKNLLPALSRKIEVNITLNEAPSSDTQGTVRIISKADDKATATKETVFPKGKKTLQLEMSVPGAKLWDIDTPNLHVCHVALEGSESSDQYRQVFGFRTIELADKGSGCNFYINNRRVRFRSAIDWGFYRGGGQYASLEQAKRSVANAKAIGHNAINFHRKIGLPRVMEEADRQGLYLYEEPGGFHTKDKRLSIEQSELAVALMMEKVHRMVIRNRNHPSVVMVCLANEDDVFTPSRQKALKMANELNNSVFVYNSSGWIAEPNIRPYTSEVRHDFYDEHTVKSDARFRDDQELVYWSHRKHKSMPEKKMKELPFYWGEVRCFTGPANYYLLHEQALRHPVGTGYDFNLNKILHAKIGKAFKEWNLAEASGGVVKTPADVSRQVGRGLMYIDGRLSQKIMVTDYEDGYAINGWSQGPRMRDPWMSAICDEGRNLKGPAGDYAWWVRPLQVAIIRQRGTALLAGKTAQFLVVLVNEGKLEAGNYKLAIHVTDGAGKKTGFSKTADVKVEGGDVYAQEIFKNLDVQMKPGWHAGYVTIHGELSNSGGKVVATGAEQVLLANRSCYKPQLDKLKGTTFAWPAANKALEDAGVTLETASSIGTGKLDYIAAGPSETIARWEKHGRKKKPIFEKNKDFSEETALKVLKAVKDQGTTAVIHFDGGWAKILHDRKILSEPVTQWGGKQWGGWKGNGWGCIGGFLGDRIVPSKTVIGTNAWGIPEDPVGFYPFSSTHRIKAYGYYIHEHQDLMATLGEIEYGKGRIILAPGYPVDRNHAFTDLLFYNMIIQGCGKSKT